MKIRYALVLVFILSSTCLFGQQEAVELYIPDTAILLGNTATIEIRVNNFSDIISMQGSINWDPTGATFVDVSAFGLKDLGVNSFGTTRAEEGHIRFVWEPSDAVAQTLPDSSILFAVNFESTGVVPYEITMDFEDKISATPFPIEFANADYQLLTVQTFPGKIHFYELITGLPAKNSHILIYPNPMYETININNEQDLLDDVKVYSSSGKMIIHIPDPKKGLIQVPMGSYSTGIYFVDLKSGIEVLRKKVIKSISN
jgi:hypothetical protein